MQELHEVVIVAKLDTKNQAKKQVGIKGRTVLYEAKIEEEIKEEAIEEPKSETEDYIIVNIE